jgi:hypothetical protein
MQDKINNIDKPDVFSELVRQKLENHQLPVDAESWNKIEERLKPNKKRIIPFWLWLSGEAAVAVLALIFTLRLFTESSDLIGKSELTNIQHKYFQNKQFAKLEIKNATLTCNTQTKQIQTNNRPTTTSVEIVYMNDHQEKIVASFDTISSKKTIEKEDDTSLKSDKSLVQTITLNNDSVSKSKRIIPNSLVEESVNEPIIKTKNTNRWLLAATFSSEGSTPTGNGNYELATGNKNIVAAATDYTSILTPNDFSNINYYSPISFGLIFRKSLDKTISLESGLVYTYLLTTFENKGMQQNNAKLHLHYIGIPFSLVGAVWKNSKWEIYISGGIMLEKGIQSIFIQNQIMGNQTITTTASTNINGFQWSVNGAVGTTYKIHQDIGIFFEPKLSYYFENNQPISARTENLVAIGLTAGVRFQFK